MQDDLPLKRPNLWSRTRDLVRALDEAVDHGPATHHERAITKLNQVVALLEDRVAALESHNSRN